MVDAGGFTDAAGNPNLPAALALEDIRFAWASSWGGSVRDEVSATVLDRAGVEPYQGLQGLSLLPFVNGSRDGRDAVLIEKGELTSGSTWHAAGQVPHFSDSPLMARVQYESFESYKQVEKETGEPSGVHAVGSLRIARSEDEISEYKRFLGFAKRIGIQGDIIGPNETRSLWPLLEFDGFKGALHTTLDGYTDPTQTVNNFVYLARYHYFDGITCHRIIPGFVVQCGDPTATGTGGPGYEFADELAKFDGYRIGSVAMANAGPGTNGSQFFIITGDNGAALPAAYTLFGQVDDDDLGVVAALDALSNPNDGPPLEPIDITSITIQQA